MKKWAVLGVLLFFTACATIRSVPPPKYEIKPGESIGVLVDITDTPTIPMWARPFSIITARSTLIDGDWATMPANVSMPK
jgi:hypothetical protein